MHTVDDRAKVKNGHARIVRARADTRVESSRGCVYGRHNERARLILSRRKDRRRSIRPDFQSSPKCAQAGCFTRIIHSFIGHTLTCSLCEKRASDSHVSNLALLRRALERVRVSVRQHTSGSRLSRDCFLCPLTLQDFIPLRLTHPPFSAIGLSSQLAQSSSRSAPS